MEADSLTWHLVRKSPDWDKSSKRALRKLETFSVGKNSNWRGFQKLGSFLNLCEHSVLKAYRLSGFSLNFTFQYKNLLRFTTIKCWKIFMLMSFRWWKLIFLFCIWSSKVKSFPDIKLLRRGGFWVYGSFQCEKLTVYRLCPAF